MNTADPTKGDFWKSDNSFAIFRLLQTTTISPSIIRVRVYPDNGD